MTDIATATDLIRQLRELKRSYIERVRQHYMKHGKTRVLLRGENWGKSAFIVDLAVSLDFPLRDRWCHKEPNAVTQAGVRGVFDYCSGVHRPLAQIMADIRRTGFLDESVVCVNTNLDDFPQDGYDIVLD